MEPYNTETSGAEQQGASGHATREEAQQRMGAAASEVQEAVRRQADSLRRDAQDRSKEFLEGKKEFAAGELHDVAGALRSSADNLKHQHHDQAERYVRLAADSIDHFSELLRQRDVARLARDAGQLARRQPAAFLGGAVAAGFILSRFMKASSEHQHEEEHRYGRETRDSAYEPRPGYGVPDPEGPRSSLSDPYEPKV